MGSENWRLVKDPADVETLRSNPVRDRARVQANIAECLRLLGVDTSSETFQGTPERFTEYLWNHFVEDEAEESVPSFESIYRGMVVESGIEAWGMCPHHLLPVDYTISIGYIADGHAIGLSKLARIARAKTRRPALQEDITEQIADFVNSTIEGVKGVGVIVIGRHSCMARRGVHVSAPVTTSSVRGTLRESGSAKEEFLMLAGVR